MSWFLSNVFCFHSHNCEYIFIPPNRSSTNIRYSLNFPSCEWPFCPDLFVSFSYLAITHARHHRRRLCVFLKMPSLTPNTTNLHWSSTLRWSTIARQLLTNYEPYIPTSNHLLRQPHHHLPYSFLRTLPAMPNRAASRMLLASRRAIQMHWSGLLLSTGMLGKP